MAATELPAPLPSPSDAPGIALAWWPHARETPAQPRVAGWLARQAGADAAAVTVRRDAHGRPRIAIEGQHGWDAGWSHGGAVLVAAAARGLQLGVDVEALKPRPRALALARRFFTAGEARWLEMQPAATCETDFLRLWCAKEAVLKAHGRGIAFGLDRLEFAPDDAGALRLRGCAPALGRPEDWRLHESAALQDYRIALAWRDTPAGIG